MNTRLSTFETKIDSTLEVFVLGATCTTMRSVPNTVLKMLNSWKQRFRSVFIVFTRSVLALFLFFLCICFRAELKRQKQRSQELEIKLETDHNTIYEVGVTHTHTHTKCYLSEHGAVTNKQMTNIIHGKINLFCTMSSRVRRYWKRSHFTKENLLIGRVTSFIFM